MALPDLESLRCFEAVASRLSFRRGAEAVGLSPQAVTSRISALEDLLGAPLLKRTTRTVSLTSEGLRLLEHARSLLALAGRSAEIVHSKGPAPVHLRLGTRFELGLSWLVPALPALERVAPLRTFELVFGTGPELMRELGDRHLDAVITSARLTDPGIVHVRLHEERYALVASPRLLKKKPIRTFADAAAHVLVDTTDQLPLFRYFLDACPRDERWEFSRIELLGVTAAMRLRLLQGHGVGVLPLHLVRADLAKGTLVVAGPKRTLPSDSFRLVWRSGHPLTTQLHALGADLAAIPLR